MNDVRQTLRSFVIEQFLDGAAPEQLADDTSLERAQIVDSARMMELILFLEERFALQVENEEALPENFDTIDRLVAYVERKLGGQ
ncbi:MAG: acyl carrier protein [Proteobacteria bacterium]|nr:acyl carrier protein [Pseudomonadota bacterium]